MKLFKKLGAAVVLASSLGLSAQEKLYPISFGRPTAEGIEDYVYDHADSVNIWFCKTLGVNSLEFDIYPEQIPEYEKNSPPDFFEAGMYYYQWSLAVIDVRALFNAYSMRDVRLTWGLTPLQQISVRGAMLHEKGHHHIHYISDSLYLAKQPSPYYYNRWRAQKSDSIESQIIQEGICKYVEWKTGELVIPNRRRRSYYQPKKLEDFTDSGSFHYLKYEFGFHFVRDFLDSVGFKGGLDILLTNPPPTREEFLQPELFYQRILENNTDARKEDE